MAGVCANDCFFCCCCISLPALIQTCFSSSFRLFPFRFIRRKKIFIVCFTNSVLQRAYRKKHIDINCVDSLGRGALTIAIDAENLEMVELLVIMSVDTKDALLQAINAEFVEAVELLLEVGSFRSVISYQLRLLFVYMEG